MATWIEIGPRGVRSVQAANETTAPTATEGALLTNVAGFDIVVTCDVGQSFSAAAGQLSAYRSYPSIGVARADEALDLAIPASAVSQRRIVFTNFNPKNPVGRVAHLATNLSLTGGGVTIDYVPSGTAGTAL